MLTFVAKLSGPGRTCTRIASRVLPLLALLSVLVPASAPGAPRDQLLRWMVPPETVTGYDVYQSSVSGSFGPGVDIGFHAPDAGGVASFLLTGLDSASEYFVVMTAYNTVGESGFSNEIRIAPLDCVTDADCDDADACNGVETCQSAVCVAGTAPVCAAPSQCMQSFCDPVSVCGESPEPDGTLCDDGDPTTLSDACSTGVCLGLPAECLADADCDDGDACNGVETCTGFSCASGVAPICAAPTQCTDSLCDPGLGCQEIPVADGTGCDDADAATVNDACAAGACLGAVPECLDDLDCDDQNSCTVQTCGADFACTYSPLLDGIACYDSDPDTIGDFCLAGACEASCRVGVDCEAEAGRDYVLSWELPADPTVAGFFLYLRFELGEYGDPLDLGFVPLDAAGLPFFSLTNLDATQTYHATVTAYDVDGVEWVVVDEFVIPALICDMTLCDDGNSCTADACAPTGCTNDVLPDDAPCDDGDPATVLDVCIAGICTGGLAECSEDRDCDDADVCNGIESCGNFQCLAGMPPVCPPSNQCASSVCDPIAGCQVVPLADGTPCNDGDMGTLADVCFSGVCTGTAGNCTADTDCDDGTICTGTETCQNFSCVAGEALTCATALCMDSSCDAITGCEQTPQPNGTSCDDGDPFTKGDVCSASGTVCSGTVPQCLAVVCEDGDFWCELTKMLSEVVGNIDKGRRRPCL